MSVSYELRRRTAVVTIHRPERRNAVDAPTATALADAFRRFEADGAVWLPEVDDEVILLRGRDQVLDGPDLVEIEEPVADLDQARHRS